MALLNRIRPQVLVGILLVGTLAGYALRLGEGELAGVAVGGIVGTMHLLLKADEGA